MMILVIIMTHNLYPQLPNDNIHVYPLLESVVYPRVVDDFVDVGPCLDILP